MKATGLVRRIDELGRIILPAEIRKQLDIKGRDSIEFFWYDNHLVLGKHEPVCTFCGGTDGIITFAGKNICKECRAKISKLK